MNDDELESLLQRFAVRGPNPELREAILAPRGPAALWGPVAAAAILVVWLVAQAARIEPDSDPMREAAVESIAAALGGGENATRYAEAAVWSAVDLAPADPEEPW